MKPIIDQARPGEAAKLTAIAHAAKRHWGYPEAWIARWAGTLTLTPGYIAAQPTFAARVGEEVVGFHALVLPAAMGQGIGRALFEHAEAFARQNGAKRLWVESDPHAEKFYQHMGMTVYGRQPAPLDGQPRFLPLLEKL